jgi:hypothetical protein
MRYCIGDKVKTWDNEYGTVQTVLRDSNLIYQYIVEFKVGDGEATCRLLLASDLNYYYKEDVVFDHLKEI